MQEKVVRVGGQEVPFRSSAAIPRLYRIKFKRDIFKDLSRLESSYKKKSAQKEDAGEESGSTSEVEDAVAAAVGPLLIILGTVVSKTGQAMQGFVKLAQGFGKLKVPVSGAHGLFGKLGAVLGGVSGPVLAVVAVIAVLAAAFVKLWNTNEEFRDAMTAIWEGIAARVQAFTQGIRERLGALDLDFTAIVETLKADWDGFCELLAPVFEAAFSAVSALLGTVLDALTGLFDVFAGLFTGNWTQW